jgi:DHA2 family integral membrane protein (MFS transporter)
MAPATDAVVGAVPAAKSGVASATNTVARMVSGALGVAVIGSLVGSLYASDVEGSLGALPPGAQASAEDSIGAASAIAARLPQPAASELVATTGDAFTRAMGIGLGLTAVLVAATAVLVLRFLPAREPAAEARVEAVEAYPLVETDRAA